MTAAPRATDRNRVACDICLEEVPLSEAIVAVAVAGERLAHFCGIACYEKWKSQFAGPEERAEPARRAKKEEANAPPPEVQLGRGRGNAQDERVKQLIKQHPQRDEPLLDSVESYETPPS
ncbi:MAG TPA: DUF3330 domain-containing protein [Usitatibacter sp.]